MEKAIKMAKANYRDKLEENLTTNNPRYIWQGLKVVTNYNTSSKTTDTTLPDNPNDFYSRFDKQNTISPPSVAAFHCDVPPFTVDESVVKCMFERLNSRKAAGPDNVSPCLLKQKCSASYLNDYRPVALTSVVMKMLKRLVLQFLKSIIDPMLDRFQFAYCANRSVDDAVSLGLFYVLKHLEGPDTFTRILFVDYSSAFNTIIPSKLFEKIQKVGVPQSMWLWILDFLFNRPQVVKIGGNLSSSLILSTDAPQGCVLPPMLYSLFTYDCASCHKSTQILKFAADTTYNARAYCKLR